MRHVKASIISDLISALCIWANIKLRPDIRKAKASARTGWAYFGDLVKLLHKELGEEKTVAILTNLMEANV